MILGTSPGTLDWFTRTHKAIRRNLTRYGIACRDRGLDPSRTATVLALGRRLGLSGAGAITGYLRDHPEMLAALGLKLTPTAHQLDAAMKRMLWFSF